jgi:hypothetical protein
MAIILTLGIPIVAIIGGFISSIRKNQNETELRRLIIENQTDLETAKALIAEPDKKAGNFGTLRGACALIGLGFGAIASILLGLPLNGSKGIYFWILLAFGVGLGLLVSFLVEMKLQKKMKNEE